MPSGARKRAAAAAPSVSPGLPAAPATVLTTPSGVILRMVLLPVSATKRFPALSTAIPPGDWKRAALPGPSALPGAPIRPAMIGEGPPVGVGTVGKLGWMT